MKKSIIILLTLAIISVLCLALVSCNGETSEFDGKYYAYYGTEKDGDTWIKISGDTWKMSDGKSGSFEQQNGMLDLYIDDNGAKTLFGRASIDGGYVKIIVGDKILAFFIGDEDFTRITAITYSASFLSGDGAVGTAPDTIAKKQGEKFILPKNTFERTGFVFIGWSDGSSVFAVDAEYTMPDMTVNFVAQWDKTDKALSSCWAENGTSFSNAYRALFNNLKNEYSGSYSLSFNYYSAQSFKNLVVRNSSGMPADQKEHIFDTVDKYLLGMVVAEDPWSSTTFTPLVVELNNHIEGAENFWALLIDEEYNTNYVREGEWYVLNPSGEYLSFNFANAFIDAAEVITYGATAFDDGKAYKSNGRLICANDSSATAYTVPNDIQRIGSMAFAGCAKLNSVTLHDSVTEIGNFAFSACTELSTVTIGINSILRHVGEGAFYYTKWYNSLPQGINYLGKVLFMFNGEMSTNTKVTVLAGTKEISDYAFFQYDELISITFPDTLLRIGKWAFENCTGLTSLTMPKQLSKIELYAFRGCSKLTSLTVASGNGTFSSVNDCIINVAEKTLVLGCINSVIPSNGNVTKIGDGAFEGCSELTSISIPSCITEIGICAFYDCKKLSGVVIPNGIKKLNEAAFYNCFELTSIVIPDGITILSKNAFYGCKELSSITIPKSVRNIADSALFQCTALTEINFGGTKSEWDAISKGLRWDYSTSISVIHCTDGNITY